MTRHSLLVVSAFAAALLGAPIAEAADPIRIGVPVIFSGPGAFVGESEKKVLDLQVEVLNAKGGIAGRPVELLYYDTEGKPDVAVRMFNRLIKNDKVAAILGPTASWEALPVKPIVEQSGIPTIMLASTRAIVEPVGKCVFKTPPDDRIVVAKLYEHLKAAGLTRLAIVTSQDGFGDGGRAELVAQAGPAGLSIVFDEKYSMEDADLSPLLNKIKRTDAQAVVNWSSSRAPILMTVNYRNIGLTLPLYQSHAAISEAYLKGTAANSEGVMAAGAKLDAADDLLASDPQYQAIHDFKSAFKAKYNQNPTHFGAGAYDAFNMLSAAIAKVGTDPAKLCAALETVKDHRGVSGVFNYSASDHGGLGKDSVVMYKASGGAWKMAK